MLPFKFSILIVDAGLLALAIGLSASTLHSFFQSRREKSDPLSKKEYEDQDGIATKESIEQYSAQWQNILLAIITAAGTAVAVVYSILTCVNSWGLPLHGWLNDALWASHFSLLFYGTE